MRSSLLCLPPKRIRCLLTATALILRDQEIKEDMIEALKKLRSKLTIGIVGGSDLSKQYEQLGKTGAIEQ